jgi:hypothetical protein
MATKSNPGQFDCYEKAEPNEPMFVLLARDRHAPTLTWLWATLRELDGEKPEVVAEARQCVESMIVWASEHGRKSCGLGQATLAGIMELIRTINGRVRDAKNAATDTEDMRRWLAVTKFETPPARASETGAAASAGAG